MQNVIPGHTYLLANFDDDSKFQELQFIHKEPEMLKGEGLNPPIPTKELKTVRDGTTNEEVLKVLIDRLQFLNNKFPCRENSIVITKLEESLMWLEKRTKDRKARGVEGQHKV